MKTAVMRVLWLGLLGGLIGCPSATEEIVKPDPVPTSIEAKAEVETKAEIEAIKYPATRAEDVKDVIHGVEVRDPYRWLEDVKSEEVKGWMKAQDDLTRAHLAGLPGRDRLVARLKELYYVDTLSAPSRRGERYFYQRRHADKEKAVIYWRQGEEGEERVLLDPNAMSAERGENISLGVWEPTLDGLRVAYTLKANNADEATLYVMEVATGAVSEVDVIEGAKYASPSWTPKGDGFYYTWLPIDPAIPTAERPGFAEVRFHKLGTDPTKDPVIHEKLGDPRKFLSADLSRDGKWLFVYKWNGWTSVEITFRSVAARKPGFAPFFNSTDAQASVIAWEDHFYILTNEGAPRWRVYRTRASKPGREAWVPIVEQRDDVVIDGMQIVGGRLVLNNLKNAASTLEVRELDGKLVREVPLPGIGATSGMTGNPEDDAAYFSFTSFTTPWQIYRTSIKSGQSTLWAEVKIPVDATPYKVEQVWYTSKDGTKVSMFIVQRADAPKDGSTPFLLYGYGGFQVNMKPFFSSGLFPWLEAGGGYAVPNLRGGAEYGEQWHQDGMVLKKQNVFDDFIAASRFLIDGGYTAPERLAIRGGSNGGLLVGAAMTQAPELFGAVICGVPLLDMVRYHLFGSGKTWISEYGSADDEAQFKALYAYSPYHQVKPGVAYPAVLFMTSDTDDRVDPLHARKMAAAVQALSSGDQPVLLRIQAQAGHGGSDLVKERVEESADMYAFLMSLFGMNQEP